MPDEILPGLRDVTRANASPLHDAVDRLGQAGPGLELDASRTEDGDITGELGASVGLGKGWTLSGGAAYAQRQWAAIGKLIWRPKP